MKYLSLIAVLPTLALAQPEAKNVLQAKNTLSDKPNVVAGYQYPSGLLLKLDANSDTWNSTAPATNNCTPGTGSQKPTWISATEGWDFNGGNQVEQQGRVLHGLRKFTMCMWTKPTSGYGVWLFTSPGTTGFEYWGSGKTGGFIAGVGTFTMSTPVGEWHHIAITFNTDLGDGKELKFFVDGQLYYERSRWNIPVSQLSSLWFGVENGTGYRHTGRMDDMRIFNTDLSPTQIAALYAAEKAQGK